MLTIKNILQYMKNIQTHSESSFFVDTAPFKIFVYCYPVIENILYGRQKEHFCSYTNMKFNTGATMRHERWVFHSDRGGQRRGSKDRQAVKREETFHHYESLGTLRNNHVCATHVNTQLHF